MRTFREPFNLKITKRMRIIVEAMLPNFRFVAIASGSCRRDPSAGAQSNDSNRGMERDEGKV